MITLNLFSRSPFASLGDSLVLLGSTTVDATEAVLGFRRAIVAWIVPRLRALPPDRRRVYWRHRRQGATILEALEVAEAELERSVKRLRKTSHE